MTLPPGEQQPENNTPTGSTHSECGPSPRSDGRSSLETAEVVRDLCTCSFRLYRRAIRRRDYYPVSEGGLDTTDVGRHPPGADMAPSWLLVIGRTIRDHGLSSLTTFDSCHTPAPSGTEPSLRSAAAAARSGAYGSGD